MQWFASRAEVKAQDWPASETVSRHSEALSAQLSCYVLINVQKRVESRLDTTLNLATMSCYLRALFADSLHLPLSDNSTWPLRPLAI